MTTILAIHAHPDDLEILAGGTLALLARAGHRVVMATMTSGDCGSTGIGPEEIAAIRHGEAARSAARIGAEYLCLGFPDVAIFNDDPSRRRVTETLRHVAPDIVITASPKDYMCDHEATSRLVFDACFAAPIPNYATRAECAAPPLAAIPHLYFADPIDDPVAADFYVDIGESFEEKRFMLATHASQREWLLRHHGMDNYLLEMERWTRLRGEQGGCLFAEGFRQYRGHAYPRTPRLQSLLPCREGGKPG